MLHGKFGWLLALSLVSAVSPAFSARADETPPRSLSTSGEAIVYVVPDEVIVNFGIETFSPDLDKAKSANDERASGLVKSIKGLGIDEKHIRTDTLQVQIQYRGRAWEGVEGYIARRAYSVTLKDTKLFEKLIDEALKNGANELAGFEFRTTELRKHRDEARVMAIRAAKEKAAALAKELDCGVGKPRLITENGEGYFGGYGWRMANSMAQNAVQIAPGGGGESDESLPLGQIAVRATVSVTFDLTDK
jgi:uncharacterized protein YggE